VSDPAGLRLAPLGVWLSENVDGFDNSAPLVAQLLAGGRSNVSYKLTSASGRNYVLRRPPLGNIMPSAHDMQREHRVLSGLNRVDFPTPAALAICENSEVIGSQFMVMDFVDGRVIADSTDAQSLTPAQAGSISNNLVHTLAQLHLIDPADAGLEELGRPQGYLQRQAKRWGEQWAITKTRELPDIEHLHTWLTKNLANLTEDLPTGIVHGDYRIDNVILDSSSLDIKAVLDWEMSTLGDPISDLAISLVYWSQATDTLRSAIPVAEHVTDGDGFWTRTQIIDEYVSATNFSIEHLDECVALACFKLAVIMESIHKRNLDGLQLGAASGNDNRMGEATLALTQLGLATIESGAVNALNS
jgi:aminoglycoside phosphotransferase (APT) family kinase protein